MSKESLSKEVDEYWIPDDIDECLYQSCEHESDVMFDKILPIFLLNCDINEKGFCNQLLTACRNGSVSKINKLYLHGADFNVVDDDGRNALFHCFYQPQCLQLVLDYGTQVAPNDDGMYPWATYAGEECDQILQQLKLNFQQ